MSDGKRKDVFRFKAATDVDVLREVMRIQPFSADYGQTGRRWDELSRCMCEIHGDGSVNSYSCRRRFEDLLQNFKKDNMASLRASGTEEEYTERDQLLQDIVDMMDASNSGKIEKKSTKMAKIKKREDDSDDVRRLAMTAMKRKRESTGDDAENASSSVVEASKKPNEPMAILRDYTAIAQESNKMQKESNDIAKRRIELDETKFKFEQDERIAQREIEPIMSFKSKNVNNK
ncbi:hypothetical protein AC1031_000130 [Aphanomyces cochlioides]|nr:hypothetical protein AC1031_000130 [Aphanomyces cochlioides]